MGAGQPDYVNNFLGTPAYTTAGRCVNHLVGYKGLSFFFVKQVSVRSGRLRQRRRRRQRRPAGRRGAADAVGAARAAHRAVGDRAHPAAAHVQLAEPAAASACAGSP